MKMKMPCKLKEEVKNHSIKKQEKYPPKCIMVVERDIIRKLIIPRERNQNVTSLSLLSKSQFNEIKEESKVVPNALSDKRNSTKMLIEKEEEKIDLLNQEIEQLKNQQVKELEEEEELRKEEILIRTEEMKREYEDEIKKCNSLILSVKCKAIQDTQIAEKELIKQQLRQQENFIEHKIEEDRKQAIKTIHEKREHDWAKKKQYAESVLQQIRNNERIHQQKMQMKQNELKVIMLKTSKMNEDEAQNLRKQSTIRMQIKNQNEKINEKIKRDKEQEKENEKLESLKIQEYLKNKLNQEKELEKHKKKSKQMEEMEFARLWKLQNNTQSLQQLKNEIMEERIQEQVEQKWRQKELETMQKKIREIEEIQKIREKQILEKRKYQALEYKEKKEEASKTMNIIMELREEQEQLKLKRRMIMEQYKAVLHQQITEKEQQKQKQRQNILQEREDLLSQIQQRDQIIKETIKKKIDQIKLTNIPETYIKQLEKHLNLQ